MDAQATDWQRWRERLGYVAAMVVFGWVGGLIVGWFSNDPDGVRQWLAGDLPTFPVSMARAPWDAFFYGTIYSVAIWTACLWAAAQAHRFVPLRSWRAALVHVFWVTLAGSTAFTLVYWMDPVFCHLLGLGDKSIDERPPFGVVLSVCAGAMLIACLIMYAMGFYRQLRTAEEAVLKAELKALRAQVNPHFLFNTLNSIAALVHARPDDAERMTERLANLFRYTLRSSEQPVVTLAEDLQATQTYIAIEQVRFRERMVVQVDVPERLHQARVPSLMLQPLVENAVKYGVANAEDACAIRIRASEDDGELLVEVRDTGPGFDSTEPELVCARGTGLANVRDRLRILFGPLASLDILPDGVALRMPYEHHADPHRTATLASPALERSPTSR